MSRPVSHPRRRAPRERPVRHAGPRSRRWVRHMIDGKIHVLLLENIHAEAVSRLESEGYLVETVSGALDEDELVSRVAGVNLLGIRSKTRVTPRVLRAADKL